MVKEIIPWKKISSKVILNDPQLRITKDRVLLPNGHKSTYVRRAPVKTHSVLIIAISSTNKILVQKEYSYPPNKVMWQFPGGSIKRNEPVQRAALRELSEESGFNAKKTKVIGYYYVNNRLSDQKQYVVLCQDLFERKLKADRDEFINSFWLSKRQLNQMIAKGEVDNINMLAALSLWASSKDEDKS